MKEFIAYAKARPGKVTYGSSGIAKTDHVAAELFAQGTGVRMLHVPFKALGDAINEMLAGRVDCVFSAAAPMATHIRSGKLRILGIVSGQRSKLFPDVPTIAEAAPLPGYGVEAWNGLMAPAKTPPAIINRLNAEIARMLKDDAIVNGLLSIGLEPIPTTPQQMAAQFRREVETYAALFRQLGIKLD